MISVILPFHSLDLGRIEASLELILSDHSHRHLISEVLLCHNGSWGCNENCEGETNSLKLQNLAHKFQAILLHTNDPGIGAGYRLGLLHAKGRYALLSASDLPFGLSDIAQFAAFSPHYPVCAVGSKWHANSDIKAYSIIRKIPSYFFRLVRALLLPVTLPRDTQGTIIIETDMCRSLLSEIGHDDYFFSTELMAQLARQKIEIVEVPIQLEPAESSSISVLRDGAIMLIHTWKLGKKLRQP